MGRHARGGLAAAGFYGHTFWVAAPERVPLVVRWERSEAPSIPPDDTVRLARGKRIEGLVVDEEQRPVAGAKVRFQGEGIK